MRRREVLGVLGGAAAGWPFAARAQPAQRKRRIGILLNYTPGDPQGLIHVDAFRKRLEELGWSERSNIEIDERWAGGDMGRLRTYATELVERNPSVILAVPTPATAAAQQATRTIPIVFVSANNPIGSGFVASLARPGGNITGFVQFEPSHGGKWLSTLKETAPMLGRVGLLYNPQTHTGQYFQAVETASQSLAVEPVRLSYRDEAELVRSIADFARRPNGGLIVLPDSTNVVYRDVIAKLAVEHRLPIMASRGDFAVAGALAYYGVDQTEQYKQAAGYVDRILRGEKPADLPVQSATKYELVINLKTAKALGLDVPLSVLAQANEVIE